MYSIGTLHVLESVLQKKLIIRFSQKTPEIFDIYYVYQYITRTV